VGDTATQPRNNPRRTRIARRRPEDGRAARVGAPLGRRARGLAGLALARGGGGGRGALALWGGGPLRGGVTTALGSTRLLLGRGWRGHGAPRVTRAR
jgi:hypothetical protein